MEHVTVQASSQSWAALSDQVTRLKARLDVPRMPRKELLEILEALRALGNLPTKVLKDTGIGVTIGRLAKDSSVEEHARASAKSLVDEWRQAFKKRRSEEDEGGDAGDVAPPPSKRSTTHADKSDLQRPPVQAMIDVSTEASAESLTTVISTAVRERTERQDPIQLIVDLHERCSNRTPRDIYEAIKQRLEGLAHVEFQKLKLGDYLWLRQNRVLGACIERKTVNDLVGRSAKGDHLRQLRRLRGSTLPWPALLLEGDEAVADTSKAIAWGAAVLSDNPLDRALRSSCNVLCFLAQVVIDSQVFVLV
jgi:hypothetical protein